MQTISLFRDLNRPGFHTSIVTTFSVDAAFYDGSIFRRLRTCGCDNVLLLADKRMLDRAIAETPESFRHAGTGYAILPAEIPTGCFHPKLHIRLGADGGSLVVGSANATAAGWGGNRELVAKFEWWQRVENADNDAVRSLIRKAFDYVLPWIEQPGLVSLRRKLELIERDAAWLLEATANDAPVTLADGSHADLLVEKADGGTSILRRFADLVTSKAKRLLVVSPYWDVGLKALHALQDQLVPAETVIAVSAHKPEFPVDDLKADRRVQFAKVFDGSGSDRFIHAKLILVETDSYDYLLLGSTNCSTNALGSLNGPAANAEASLYRRLPAGTGLAVLGLNISNVISPSEIVRKSKEDELPKGTSLPWPGTIEAAGKTIRWAPAASLASSAAGAFLLLGEEQHPFTRIRDGNYSLELPALPKYPVIARIRLEDGQTTSAVLVNDELRLQQAAPGMGNRQLRAVLERIDDGDHDLLDLAAIASIIFSSPERSASTGQRSAGTGAKSGSDKGTENDGHDYDSAKEFRDALGNNLPGRGEDHRLNFNGPDEIYLFKILMKGMSADEPIENLDSGDTEPPGSPGDNDDSSDQAPPPELPRRLFSEAQVEKRRLNVFRAMNAFEKRLAGLKASPLPPPRKITAEACFILRLMVEASRRAMLRNQDDEEAEIYALPLVPGLRGNREDTFVIRAGKMLQSLWVGSKSSPPLLSRLQIGQHFDELPYDCFALVVMSRWASARCVLSMANDRNKGLAAIVGQTAIQIWRATTMWPPVDSSAEIEFVRRLDQILGIRIEETEELIAHYRTLSAALTLVVQAAE